MPFKPFAHLARVSLAKGITHAYAPSAVVAGQSIGGFHSSSANKFSKATHVQNVFTGSTSSGAGAGAKAGHTGQSSGGDNGLAQYYAAWQHAQQTGDDTDWKQHQFARRIGWKNSDKPAPLSKPSHHRLDSVKPADILRPSINRTRGYSETVITDIQNADDAFAEAEALAKVDEAIAREIQDVKEANSTGDIIADAAAGQHNAISQDEGSYTTSEPSGSAVTETRRSPSTVPTSPVLSEAFSLSEDIVQLGRDHRYTDIPQRFELMIKDGLVPTVEAYNQVIVSSIKLSNRYQHYPRALEIYSDMANRSVAPNQETFSILIPFLTGQSLEAIRVQKDLAEQNQRYGLNNGTLVLPSLYQLQERYAGDASLQFATRFYNIASGMFADFRLTAAQFNRLLMAYAQNGSAQHMKQLIFDMRAQGAIIELELYVPLIDACTSVKDVDTAKKIYAEYRDRAMGRSLDAHDIQVYTALIRSFYAAGQEEHGIQFYEQILGSFEGTAEVEDSCRKVTDAFVVDGLVQHHMESSNYEQALQSVEMYPLTDTARVKALNKICTVAADNGKLDTASATYTRLQPNEVTADCAMAVSAMHFRAGHIEDALMAWERVQRSVNPPAGCVEFATMLTLSLINAGMIEQGLGQIRTMFRHIRSANMAKASSSPPQPTTRALDEAILLIGQILSGSEKPQSAQASVLLFRLMIENGGLVPPITQDAIARLGPDCVDVLSPQDIALALHVQAHILPSQNLASDNLAQAERFSHLLETVLNHGILMDPSTLHAVTDALPRLGGARPDLERRWNDFVRPAPREVPAIRPAQLSVAQSPAANVHPMLNFDPYSGNTDHRASRAISELLESTTGRIENHISDAMSRLRNVRRMGRHLQYNTYAKLITAAGKAKQSNLMNEILGMTQTDVPFNTQFPAVVTGWVSIYDAMVAACLTVGDRQTAVKYHHEIRSLGAAPSANTFGIYITTLEGTFDEATEAVKIFQQALREGVQPSVFLFNAVIGKLGKARRIDDCLHYFSQMQERGVKPSSVTYGTLVNALCRTSEESFAVQVFDEMELAPNYRPRPAPYNSIIQYFLNTKRDRSQVLQYYGRMQTHNIKPTSHTYKLLIEAYATLEPINLTAAETILTDMRAKGVQPEAVHYGSLIHARGCVMSDMAGARKVFDSVIADKSIRPTDNLYQNLFEAMVANHEVDQTDALLVDMDRRGISMTPYIANTLIHGWAGKGNIAKAKAIYESLGLAHREPSTYEAMTRAYLTADDHTGANGVVAEMMSKGYPSAVADKVLSLLSGSAHI